MSSVAALLLALIGTDRLGDPLGPGVSARYGTNRLCVGQANTGELRFHPVRDELYLCPNGRLKNPGEGKRGVTEARGWKLPPGAEVFRHRIPPEPDALNDIVFDPTGRYRLMVYSSESRVWDEVARREIANVSHANGVCGIVGFRDGRVVTRSYADLGGKAPPARVDIVQSVRVSDGTPVGGKVGVGAIAAAALSPCGKWLWVAEDRLREIRSFTSDSGVIRSWRRAPTEDDVDQDQFTKASTDGRKLFMIQCRQNEKADRYRGHPECFVQVFDTASNRVQARHAFRLDDVGTGERLKPSEEGDGGFAFHLFTPSEDGQLFAWVDHLGHLRIRHLPTGRVVTAPGTEYTQCPLAFSPDGERLAVCGYDGIVRLIDPYTGRFQNAADNPPTAATQAAISPDGKLVATGHACGEVWVWDAATGKPLWHTEPDGSPVREVHFNPTGTTVSAVGFWGPIGIRSWNAKTGQELGPMLPYRYFRTIAVSADGKRIADLIEEKGVMEKGGWAYPLFVRTREIATGKEVGRVRLDHRLGLSNETNAVVSRDGRVMVVTHNADGGETIAYDTATGKRLCQFDRHPANGNSDWTVSADGQIVAQVAPVYTNANRPLRVFDLTAVNPNRPVREYEVSQDTRAAILSPDGRYVALNDPTGCVVDVRRGGGPLRVYSYPVTAFFPDGKSVLTRPGIRGAERVSLEPLAWKVAPPAKLSEARLKQLWTQLAEPAALEAVFELARHSAEVVPFLKSKLLTTPPDATAVAAHIERLGSKLFAEREAASKALRELGPEVLPALRAARKAGPSPEVRSRLEKLIAGHADTAAPFTLARLRGVEVLERCDTPDSRALLKTLADTRSGTPWADDARRALMRLKR